MESREEVLESDTQQEGVVTAWNAAANKAVIAAETPSQPRNHSTVCRASADLSGADS